MFQVKRGRAARAQAARTVMAARRTRRAPRSSPRFPRGSPNGKHCFASFTHSDTTRLWSYSCVDVVVSGQHFQQVELIVELDSI